MKLHSQKTQNDISPSTPEHLERAYCSNVRSETDPEVIDALAAGRAAKARLENGDYASLVEALEDRRRMQEHPFKRAINGDAATNRITAKDLECATHYTTLKFVKKFIERYGMEPPAVGVKIPQKKWAGPNGLAKKLGMPGGVSCAGVSFPKDEFRKEPYNKTGVTLISTMGRGNTPKNHELLHSVYALREKHVPPGTFPYMDDARYLQLVLERALVDEISAFRSKIPRTGRTWQTDKMEKVTDTVRTLAGRYVKLNIKSGYFSYYKQSLRDAGIDRKCAKGVLKSAKAKIGNAVDAVRYMQDEGVPEAEITRRLIAVGPTYNEMSCGEFYSPLNDVVAWGKYTKCEVAKGKCGTKG